MATYFVKKMANSALSSLWNSETEWDNAVYMHYLIAPKRYTTRGGNSPRCNGKTAIVQQITGTGYAI